MSGRGLTKLPTMTLFRTNTKTVNLCQDYQLKSVNYFQDDTPGARRERSLKKIYFDFRVEMRDLNGLTHSTSTAYPRPVRMGHPPGHPMDHPMGHPWDTRGTHFHKNGPKSLQVSPPQRFTAVDAPVDGPWTLRGRSVDDEAFTSQIVT